MDGYITRDEFYGVTARIEKKVDRAIKAPRFITRSEILNIEKLPESIFNQGIESGRLTPLKGKSRNSPVLFERLEYENFLLTLKR
jgi:hypothetical protein